MNTMQITVTESQQAFIEDQAATGGHGSPSDYLLSLVREAQRKRAWEVAEPRILAGLDSPAREMVPGDWQQVREKVTGAAPPNPS